jgi:hypothetical protein
VKWDCIKAETIVKKTTILQVLPCVIVLYASIKLILSAKSFKFPALT